MFHEKNFPISGMIKWKRSKRPEQQQNLHTKKVAIGGSVCVCVCCFVLLNRYWGVVTVPGSIYYGSRPGVAGSSPFTLSTSLVIPVPSSSSVTRGNRFVGILYTTLRNANDLIEWTTHEGVFCVQTHSFCYSCAFVLVSSINNAHEPAF